MQIGVVFMRSVIAFMMLQYDDCRIPSLPLKFILDWFSIYGFIYYLSIAYVVIVLKS